MVPTSNQSRLRTVCEAREMPLRIACATLSVLVPTISVMPYVWSAIGCPLRNGPLRLYGPCPRWQSVGQRRVIVQWGARRRRSSDAVPDGCPRGRSASPGWLSLLAVGRRVAAGERRGLLGRVPDRLGPAARLARREP